MTVSTTKGPVCPHCGASQFNYWEWCEEGINFYDSCGDCDETFVIETETVTTYTTTPDDAWHAQQDARKAQEVEAVGRKPRAKRP